jgi:hypothetical protein
MDGVRNEFQEVASGPGGGIQCDPLLLLVSLLSVAHDRKVPGEMNERAEDIQALLRVVKIWAGSEEERRIRKAIFQMG